MESEGDLGMLSLLLPSPQSEAVTHEMEELSLQPTHNLPPLNERKNGEESLLLLQKQQSRRIKTFQG